jgi:salicylate hydroxylase
MKMPGVFANCATTRSIVFALVVNLLLLLLLLGTSIHVAALTGSTHGEKIFDVAIIGGGPAGLSTALAAKRALGVGASVAVFERSPELLEIGGQVGLTSPAFNALDAIDPSGSVSAAVEEAGVLRKKLKMLNDKGVLENEMEIGASSKQVVIPWFALQRALANRLPSGVLRLGHELTTMAEACIDGEDCVALTFRGKTDECKNEGEDESEGEDRSNEVETETTCHARLVIGADGNLSQTRTLLFGEKEKLPSYAGSAIWRMFVYGAEFEGLEPGISYVYTGDGKVLAIQKMGDRLYLAGQAGWPEDELSVLDRRRYIGEEDGETSGGRSTNAERLERFAATFAGFPQDVVKFAVDHCETASVLEHPIYYREPDRPWGEGRVTLLGDAAHCIPPNMAMGTPLAFEDAAALGHALAKHGVKSEALRSFEADRMDRVNTIAKFAIEQTGRYYKEKDDNANPFKLSNANLFEFIMDFKQNPIPTD